MSDPGPLSEFSQISEAHHRAPEGALAKVLKSWAAAENMVVGLLAAATLGIVVYTIVVRLVAPQYTPSWSDEISVYLMVWATFIACSGVTAQDRHVRADLVTNLLPRHQQVVLEFLSYVCGAVFGGFLAWYGFTAANDAWQFDDLSTTTLRFPMWIYYASLPVGAALMTLRYVVLAFLCLTGSKPSARAH